MIAAKTANLFTIERRSMNAPFHAGSTFADGMRRLGRALTWPVRRVLDPRFGGLSQQITVTHEDAARRSDAVLAQLSRHGRDHEAQLDALARLSEGLQRLSDDVERLREVIVRQGDAALEANAIFGRSLSELLAAAGIEAPIAPAGSGAVLVDDGSVADVDEQIARLLNYAESHRGFAAQRGLWFNPPISLEYKPGDVDVSDANERVAEVPYAFRALASLPPGARVLDVGATESTLAFSLASLGYRTTALDLRPYPLSHPGLDVVVARIEEWDSEPDSFEAIVCLSTLEHVGLKAYGGASEPEADRAAMRRMRELAVSRGLLVLTVPVGPAATGETERTYDRARLDALLEGWDVEDLTIVRRDDRTTWRALADGDDWEDDETTRHVALITARRSD
jgi:hypothetical protein